MGGQETRRLVADSPPIKDWNDWQAAIQADPAAAIPSPAGGRWWVAHTRPRCEKALALELRTLNIGHYLPLRINNTRSPRTSRVSRSVVPIFPSYVFLHGDEGARQRAMTTNRIVRTLDVVHQEQLVGELRQIQQLARTCSEFEWMPQLQVGQWTRVVAGPLQGLVGVITGRRSGIRLALNVELLSQSVTVEVSREVLEPVEAPEYAR